ncbi:hypothetical protein [Persicitalea sp.]|uniref:hypothetical protein n=1 Tax=Persicitalea sp. TaxID=3100273 RepID=UPI0035947F76
MTYQINIIHPKAAALLQNLAEIGLISIGEDDGHLTKGKHTQEEVFEENEVSRADRGKQFNYDDLPPITKSLHGSFKEPDDFDYKRILTKRLTKKYLQNG